MKRVKINRIDGGEDVINVYTVNDFPYENLTPLFINCQSKRKCNRYSSTIVTFDIETTTIYKGKSPNWIIKPYAFMWHWQMCVDGIVCVGRYWEEWLSFMESLVRILEIDTRNRLCVFVHNLGYEFQFIRDFLTESFGGYEVFASKKRQPIHVSTGKGIEFRCTYKLSNMTLEKACLNEKGVVHGKAVGDLDYKVLRTPTTTITDVELGYNVSDVVSLYEYVVNRLVNENDTIVTMPMTSTGYIRRKCRNATRKDHDYREMFLSQEMTENVYTLLKEESRGGNTHANRYMSGRIWQWCDSYDVQSSYPYVLICKKFPMAKFMPYGDVESITEFRKLLAENACLFRVIINRPKLKSEVTMPYIPISKCIKHTGQCIIDNGRLLSTDGCIQLTVNDIDWGIIENQYEWESIAVSDMHISEYGYLPDSLLDVIRELFSSKCVLKYKIEHETDKNKKADLKYIYAKTKNLLNGIFGMAFTDPVKNTVTVESGEWIEKFTDIEESLRKFWRSRNSFLVYAWGCWTTSYARKHLQILLDTCGSGVIYCDTDSAKGVEFDKKAIEKLNKKIEYEATQRNAYADVEKERFYLGVYEHENKEPIKQFITLGAKKYAYVDEEGLHCTISGVSKKDGATELHNIENFKIGFVFRKAGGKELFYNDNEGIHTIEVNGERFLTASNVAMIDGEYTLGITNEYAEIIGYNIYDTY